MEGRPYAIRKDSSLLARSVAAGFSLRKNYGYIVISNILYFNAPAGNLILTISFSLCPNKFFEKARNLSIIYNIIIRSTS